MKTNYVYLRVSTPSQENEKFEKPAKSYLRKNHLTGKTVFIKEKCSGRIPWQERQLNTIVAEAKAGDIVLVPEISRLARDLFQTFDVVNKLLDKGVEIHSLKPRPLVINRNMNIDDKSLLIQWAWKAEADSIMTSSRIKEVINQKRKEGWKPSTPARDILDENTTEILRMAENGESVNSMSVKFNVSYMTVKNWLTVKKIRTNYQTPKTAGRIILNENATEVRRSLRNGATVKEICLKYNVPRQTVYNWIYNNHEKVNRE